MKNNATTTLTSRAARRELAKVEARREKLNEQVTACDERIARLSLLIEQEEGAL